jgi:hypothetical protein
VATVIDDDGVVENSCEIDREQQNEGQEWQQNGQF